MRLKNKAILFTAFLILRGIGSLFASDFELDYVFNEKWEYSWIPRTYTVDEAFTHLGSAGFLNGAEDIFAASDGSLYIADTGNHRIVKLNSDFSVAGTYYGPDDSPMNGPRGIFVDDDGDMFIADTENGRILHLGPGGEYVEEFTQPDSQLFSEEYAFRPVKVAVDSLGFLYILNRDDYHGFITMDSMNRFRGYLAPTRLEFSLKQALVRRFASKEQKNQLAKALPPYHSNFYMSQDGSLYTTTVFTPHDQIKRINAVGSNTYTGMIQETSSFMGFTTGTYSYFGEKLTLDKSEQVVPMFADVTVDEKGIVTAIDSATQKIYQYDQEGRLLAVFGGPGETRGRFKSLSSITILEDGRLAVLDRELNTLQIFKPNLFISLVHNAISLQYQGRYDEAFEPWQQVININPNYNIALSSMAKLSFKQEDWKASVDRYRDAEDKSGYSEAFAEYRKSLFRNYFFAAVLIVIALSVILVKVFAMAKRKADSILLKMIQG
ncbi:MAG: hypothetical protein PQJ58_21740 [Spirochaetales bacterium]|nr:hypothetical protein [Spirochaetales bacterium]